MSIPPPPTIYSVQIRSTEYASQSGPAALFAAMHVYGAAGQCCNGDGSETLG
jgi:hypothetical protein